MRAMTTPRWTTAVLFVQFLCNNCVSQEITGKSRQVVHSIERFYALSEEEALEGRPVRIEGVVLYSDPAWGLLWVTDETGRLFQQVSANESLVPAGSSVLVSGKTSYAGNCPTIESLRVTRLGSGVLPPPKVLMPHELKDPLTTRGLVSLSGSVVSAHYNDDEHIILVVAFLRRYFVRVTINQCQERDLEGLLGARVEVVGVASDIPDKLDDRIIDSQVFVPSLDHVTVFQRGRVDLFQRPEIPIQSIPKEFRQIRDPRFVKICGKVVDRPSQDSVVVDDGEASVHVRMQSIVRLEYGTNVEAVGIVYELQDQPKASTQNLILDRALVREAESANKVKTDNQTVLRSVSALRLLSREEAAQELPVQISGVVTYYDPVWRVLFIHDVVHGVYVDDKKQSRSLRLGDSVTIEGVSDPGGFAPMVVLKDLVKHRRVGSLPSTREFPLVDLNDGSLDSQWMSVVGTVKSAERSQKNLVLVLRNAEREFDAVVCGAGNMIKKKNWVGSRVSLAGVCGIKSNANSQAAGVYFHVPGETQIEFLSEAPSDPFSVPTIPISEVATSSSPNLGQEFRSRLTGTVTYVDRTGLVAIQDESAGVFVRLKKLEVPSVGDTIDIMGFASQRSALSTPRVSQWRQSNSKLQPPEAKEIQLSRTNPKSFKSQLVSVQGTVLRNSVGAAIPGLTVQSDGFVFSIDLASPTQEDAWTQLLEGSLIQVEGVMDIHADDLDRLESFRLLCPLSARTQVIRAAPWWNAQHTSLVIGGLIVLIVGGLGWVGTLRSTVSRQTKRIESELHARGELAHRYNTIIDNASELIFSLKRSGEFVSVNPATERAFDAPNSRLLGQQLGTYLTDASGEVLQLLMAKLEATYPHAIVELTTARGLILETALQLSLSPSGEEIQCIARDVSERQRLEQQLRHVQKLDSVGQLAAGVAHDYNNLLMVVRLNSELLVREDLGEQGQNSANMIQEAADRASKLTRQLLAFSRRQAMNTQVVNVDQLLEDISTILRELLREDIDLVVESESDLPEINADAAMIEQAIMNLALNARDAMPTGGKLGISARVRVVSADAASRHFEVVQGEYIEINVSDTGCGISHELLPNVFEPFYTTKEVGKGTGLGLSTVFGVVKQHEGWIDVDSVLDKGSKFSINLPVAPQALHESKKLPTATSDAPAKETVLIVEDDSSVRLTMSRLLERVGYEVIQSVNGPEALDLLKRREVKIDIVVTDMVMPGGLTGMEVGKEIRKMNPDMPIVYCSGYSSELMSVASLTSTERFLSKPFEATQLLSIVRELLTARPHKKSA